MLTSEQINKIAADVLNGREPNIKGAEADEFRRQFAKDVAKAEKNGWTIELPSEIAVDEAGDFEPVANAFCPTGEGGGQDNSCSSGEGKVKTASSDLTGTHKEDFDKLKPVLERQVGREITGHKKAQVAFGVVSGESPKVQKALLDHLKSTEPEAYERLKKMPAHKFHLGAFAN